MTDTPDDRRRFDFDAIDPLSADDYRRLVGDVFFRDHHDCLRMDIAPGEANGILAAHRDQVYALIELLQELAEEIPQRRSTL